MASITSKIMATYKSHGIIEVFRRTKLRLLNNDRVFDTRPPVADRYQSIEEDNQFPVDNEKLRAFYNIHNGERCFVIGNGPSLNKIDLSKIQNEFSFGVNGIFYKTRESGFRPTYYMVEDKHVMADNMEEINAYQVSHKFFPSVYRPFVADDKNISFFRMNTGFYQGQSPNFCIPRFSTDASERLYCGQSVTIMLLQLAYYMGFQQVYLIGMDFSYTIPSDAIKDGATVISQSDDPNHFHPEYFGKGKKWHDPKLDRVKTNYKLAKLVYEAKGRQIFNSTAGGKLEIFERVPFDSLFNK